MKHIVWLMAFAVLTGCNSGVNYSKALFEHVPTDPDVLVVIQPDDLAAFTQRSLQDIDLSSMFGETGLFNNIDLNTTELIKYRDLGLKVLNQTGIPVEKVETFSYMYYLGQNVFMISGDFPKTQVETKLTDLGFKQDENGFFEYIYGNQMISLPTDGLILYAVPEMLEDLAALPDDQRLWNRPDFKGYRENSPLENSIFVWSHPPEKFLSDFKHREALGDVSLAINLRETLTARATVRLKDPEKTIALFNIVSGSVAMGKGFMGDDPDLGPVLQGITVSQNNKEVVTNVIVQETQFKALRDRILREMKGDGTGTFSKIQSFLNGFH